MSGPAFHPTSWTLVRRAGTGDPAARAALADLCAAYYAPVVAFLRREGRPDDAARDLAHDFFAGLLAGGLGTPDPGRGRFRAYLLGALKHFLAKQRAARNAAKRGGGIEHVPLDESTANEAAPPGPGDPAADLHFDREWAFTLIGRALAALEAERSGRPGHFAELKPWLDGQPGESQAGLASRLGLAETAVKVAIHRLRARFRELLRAEIAATVADPAEIADELRHLVAIAARPSGMMK
jgi:DNA-directed RNA polymerase specialized sigma24 family protein